MPSDSKESVIGVDLDGVCADFYSYMRQVAAEWFERPIKTLPKKVTYGLPEWGITSQELQDLKDWIDTL